VIVLNLQRTKPRRSRYIIKIGLLVIGIGILVMSCGKFPGSAQCKKDAKCREKCIPLASLGPLDDDCLDCMVDAMFNSEQCGCTLDTQTNTVSCPD